MPRFHVQTRFPGDPATRHPPPRPRIPLASRAAVIAGATLFVVGVALAVRYTEISGDDWTSPAEALGMWWAFGSTGAFATAVVVHLALRHRARRAGVPLRSLSSDLWIVLGGGGAVALAAGALGTTYQDSSPGWMVIGALGMLCYLVLWVLPVCVFALWLSFPVWLRVCHAMFGLPGVVTGLALMGGAYGLGIATVAPWRWLPVVSLWTLVSGTLGLILLALTAGYRPGRPAPRRDRPRAVARTGRGRRGPPE
jgi:hypothetical protein